MITAASSRNQFYVEAGRADFEVANLEDFDPGDRRFDLIFAVRVRLFHCEPEHTHSIVGPWLGPGGRLETFFDPPV